MIAFLLFIIALFVICELIKSGEIEYQNELDEERQWEIYQHENDNEPTKYDEYSNYYDNGENGNEHDYYLGN